MKSNGSLLQALKDIPMDGPTVGEVQAKQREQELMAKVLDALANPPTPQVTVAAPDIPAPQVVVQPAPAITPVAWVFTFERDANGLLTSMTATPA